MIRYTAGDIVRRARQLADLENSSFISWNENISLLNEVYTTLYQRVINHGDKYYLKEMVLALPLAQSGYETHYQLPDDFYQLMSINVSDTNEPVLRRSLNDEPRSLRYDIVNNDLVIYGDFGKPLKIRYYPVPMTLAYPAEDALLGTTGMDGSQLFDCYGKVVVYKAADTTLKIYDGNTFEESELETNTNINSILAGKNGFLVNGLAYGYDMALKIDLNGYPIILDPQKNICYFTGGQVKTLAGRTVLNLHSSHTDMMGGALDDKGGLYWLTNYGRVNYWSEKHMKSAFYDAGLDTRYMMYSDGLLYRLTVNGLLDAVDDNGNDTALSDDALAINKLDGNTGYGYTVLERGAYKVRSFVQDTELDYPNNLYVQAMAYSLAMAYKAKQNADSTQLSALYEEAVQQYYDSVGRDDYASPRIQNVY